MINADVCPVCLLSCVDSDGFLDFGKLERFLIMMASTSARSLRIAGCIWLIDA
jgi:hypothetical protein